jgi:uncharacterized protein DUF3857/transglutaminase superfamily protein
MPRTWCCTRLNRSGRELLWPCALVVFLALTGCAFAGTPQWLKQAALTTVPQYPDAPDAVVLLDERLTAVSDSGEIRTTFRKAYKILRPGGTGKGVVSVYFDNDTQLTFFKAWSITSNNQEFEVKEGEAVETAAFSESLYRDTRYKILQIPGAQPGNVVGYEYQQKQRPFVLQTIWSFQDNIPVRLARFTLELPSTWKYSVYWRNHVPVSPQQTGENRWLWELANIDAVSSEVQMPTWRSLAGLMGLSFAKRNGDPASLSFSSWQQIANWYAQLTRDRRDVTPAIREKVRDIVANASAPEEKIRRLASYVQHAIRYVAIEIGIGGYVPHPAQEVLTSGYGDCKDKVTLLSSMLREVDIDSYYVLMDDDRDYVTRDFPSMLEFNHVILAIRLPSDIKLENTNAVVDHPDLGRLLFFDPTDNGTSLGYLPPYLQSNEGLIVADTAGVLVKLPLTPPPSNRLLRVANLTMDKTGTLMGKVQEFRSGPSAVEIRRRFTTLAKKRRQRIFEDLLSELIDGASLTSASLSDLNEPSSTVTLEYAFNAPAYAQRLGNLFIFHSCVLGRKSSNLLEAKSRKQPVEFSYAVMEGDAVTITLPSEYTFEEIPKSVKYDSGFAAYKNEITVAEHTLKYNRSYELRDVKIPLERLDELKQLYRRIADDERAYAILKVP